MGKTTTQKMLESRNCVEESELNKKAITGVKKDRNEENSELALLVGEENLRPFRLLYRTSKA